MAAKGRFRWGKGSEVLLVPLIPLQRDPPSGRQKALLQAFCLVAWCGGSKCNAPAGTKTKKGE